MSDLEKKFLVRSSGQILGPFSKREVIDLIKQGRISSFDEVAEPYAIWFYLEDHAEFKTILNTMDFQTRLTNFVTKITSSISTNSNSTTKNSLGEKNLTRTDTKTLTGRKGMNLDSHIKQAAREVEVQVMEKPKLESSAKYQSRRDREETIRRKVNKTVTTIWFLIVFFTLAVGGYIIYNEFVVPFQKKQEIVKQLNTEGKRFYEAGNYKKALFYYEKAYSQNVLQSKDLLLLGGIYFQENKRQKLSLILDDFLKLSQSKTENWLLLNGLLSFLRNDFTQAENYFTQAANKNRIEALLNLSILKWKMRDYTRSLSYLNEVTKKGYERGLVFYLKALNLFFQNKTEELISYIDKELLITKEISITREFHQELYFMLAYSYLKQGKTDQFEKTLAAFFNEDPFLFREYKYSPFIAVKELNWAYFYPYCKSLFDTDPKKDVLNALYGFCHLKAGKIKRGSRFIKEAKNREPHNPLFLSLYAYFLILKGESSLQAEQVLSLIDYNISRQKQLLPYIIQAYFFEQKKDWGRALTAWKSLLSLSPKNLSGLAGMAVSSYKLGDHLKGDLYKKRGLDEYPYFVRLLSY